MSHDRDLSSMNPCKLKYEHVTNAQGMLRKNQTPILVPPGPKISKYLDPQNKKFEILA